MTQSAEQFGLLGVCLGALVCVVGTLGNFMTIIAYATNPRMRNAFNLLIVNLAVTDVVISVVILPIIVNSYALRSWSFSDKSCEILGFFYFATRYTSTINLLTISFNRYMHVTRPHAAYRMMFSAQRRRLAVLLIWLFAPICLLPLLFTDGFGWWEEGFMCTYTRKYGFPNIYSLVMRLLFQLIPLLGMVILYTIIFREVKKTHANIDNPKIKVESCESDFYSTGVTWTQNGTSPSPSPSTYSKLSPSLSHKRFNPSSSTATTPNRKFQRSPAGGVRGVRRQISFREQFPLSRYPVVEEDSDAGAEDAASTKYSFENKQHSSHGLSKLPYIVTPPLIKLESDSLKPPNKPNIQRRRSNSNDDSAYYLALRRKAVVMRYAKLCRSTTFDCTVMTGSMSLADTSSSTSSMSQPQGLVACKARSVTFSCFSLVHHGDSRCSSIKVKDEVTESAPENSSSGSTGSVARLERPRTLSLAIPTHDGVVTDSNRAKSATLYERVRKTSRSASITSLSPLRMRERLSSFAESVRNRKGSQSSMKRRTSVQHAKAQRQLLYMSIVICVTFALCALPSVIFNLIGNYQFISPEFHMAAMYLGWLTSMINPIVYAAMNVQFRKEYVRVMKKLATLLCMKSGNFQSSHHNKHETTNANA